MEKPRIETKWNDCWHLTFDMYVFDCFRCGEGMQGGCPGGELPPGAPPEQLPATAAALDQAQFEADKRAVYK